MMYYSPWIWACMLKMNNAELWTACPLESTDVYPDWEKSGYASWLGVTEGVMWNF